MILKNEATTHEKLRAFRDRIVSFELQRKELAEDAKDVYHEAESEGFDKAALRKVVKRSMMDEAKREREQAVEEIADVYLANLGLLAGSSLSDGARARADAARSKPKEPEEDAEPSAPPSMDAGAVWEAEQAKSEPAPELIVPQKTNTEARAQGLADALAGLSVFNNPFVAGDPRRSYWDEGWCEGAGSDGMEVPAAWRRKSPPKKPGDE